MQVTKTKLPKSQIELQIEITSEEFSSYFKKAVKKLSSEIKLAGFRPGKIPEEILKKKVGENKILKEAAELAVQESYPKVISKEKLVTIAAPKIDILKQALNNPFIYKATVSLLPEVKLGDYKKIKAKKKLVEVKKEEIEKTLKDLQKMRRKEKLVNREARKGDKVEVDINVYRDKVPIDGGQAKNQPVVIGEGAFIPGFEDKLVGLKKDEIKEFELKFPKDYFQKHLAGRPAEFKVKINSVFELEEPNLDDELAKSLGGFQNLEELKNQITQNLEYEAKQKERQRLELEILEELIKKSDFEEPPDVLIESEAEKMIEELKYDFERQNLKFEDYLQSIKKKPEELKESFKPRALKRVQTALIIRKISEMENIEIPEEELEKELEHSRKHHAEDDDMLNQLGTPEYRSFLKNILINRKVLEFLEKLAEE